MDRYVAGVMLLCYKFELVKEEVHALLPIGINPQYSLNHIGGPGVLTDNDWIGWFMNQSFTQVYAMQAKENVMKNKCNDYKVEQRPSIGNVLIKKVWKKNQQTGNACFTYKQIEALLAGQFEMIEIVVEDESEVLCTINGQAEITRFIEGVIPNQDRYGNEFMMACYKDFK